MPRANRHFLPGQLWHITHRCRGDVRTARAARRLYEYFWHRKQCSKVGKGYSLDGKSCNCINLAWSDPRLGRARKAAGKAPFTPPPSIERIFLFFVVAAPRDAFRRPSIRRS